MKIQCTSCGASFEANERTQCSVQCPYCGSMIRIEIESSTTQSSHRYQRIIPFKISEQEARDIMMECLVNTDGVPTDVFHHLEVISVEQFFLPMYMMNGKADAPWNATAVERRTRQVSNGNGGYRTETYYERWPINGFAQSAFFLLSSANSNTDLPQVIREYGRVEEYTHTMATESISEEVQEVNYQLPDGCKEIEIDTDNHTVFNIQSVKDYINELAVTAALSQIPTSYENFRCTPRWTNDYVELVGVALYYIRFSYKGEIYEFCVDGIGESSYSLFPKDDDAVETLRKTIKHKQILTAVLSLFGTFAMPFIGMLLNCGLMLASPVIAGTMWIILLVLLKKERKAKLSNEQEQREYGRRLYYGLDTSDVNENAYTKLGVVTTILLWIGLVVDITAIIFAIVANSSHHQTYEDSADNSEIVEQISNDKTDTLNTTQAATTERTESNAEIFTSPDLAFNQLRGEVSKVEWLNSGDIMNPIAFYYDEEGNMYPVQSNDRPSNSFYRNDKGQITQESAPDNEFTYMYEWSDNHIIQKYDEVYAGELDRNSYAIHYHYVENGVLEKTTRNHLSGEGGEMKNIQTVYTDYQFDDMGNWVSRNSTTTYEIRDWEDDGDENAWQKRTEQNKEYRVIKYRNHDGGMVKSIRDMQRQWETELGLE